MVLNKYRYLKKLLKIEYLFFRYKNELDIKNNKIKIWKKKFINLLASNDVRFEQLLEEFFFVKMKKVTHHRAKRNSSSAPILFCVIKNDKNKIEQFLQHYRKMGIEVFIFLDNDSTDGTREYLIGQADTIVYYSKQEYSSVRRVAWLNRLLAIYGMGHWCMVVDSDELVDYIGSEKYLLSDIIAHATKKGIKRIEGFMLDMYSQGELFYSENNNNFVSDNCYFDSSSYELKNTDKGGSIFGGPRKRIFKHNILLSKYPVFYFGEEDILASSHYLIPIQKTKLCPIWLVLRHYKFLSQIDMEKIRDAVVKENYASNSEDYKKYLQVINEKSVLTFFDEKKSVKYDGSKSLSTIPFLKQFYD